MLRDLVRFIERADIDAWEEQFVLPAYVEAFARDTYPADLRGE
jgi:hypothetical protein